MKVVIGSTVAAWCCDGETEFRWLQGIPPTGRTVLVPADWEVELFLASEPLWGNGLVEPLEGMVRQLGGTVWRFAIDDGENFVTAQNRLHHITTGRNLIASYATGAGADWVLYLDTDVMIRNDALPKLLELDHPFVAGRIPSYCLDGPPWQNTGGYAQRDYPRDWDVQVYQESAGFWLVHRSIFQRIRWRTDLDRGMTDDPAYHADVKELLGIDMLVRRDVVGDHLPLAPVHKRDQPRRQVPFVLGRTKREVRDG